MFSGTCIVYRLKIVSCSFFRITNDFFGSNRSVSRPLLGMVLSFVSMRFEYVTVSTYGLLRAIL